MNATERQRERQRLDATRARLERERLRQRVAEVTSQLTGHGVNEILYAAEHPDEDEALANDFHAVLTLVIESQDRVRSRAIVAPAPRLIVRPVQEPDQGGNRP